ncbi:hypothetical protein GGS24DRAFT_461608 [Hypoxylon argillaceum]|nr:hypothetical protein GGS24DRAFT_461608 [Hypoxylon argillaceum]
MVCLGTLLINVLSFRALASKSGCFIFSSIPKRSHLYQAKPMVLCISDSDFILKSPVMQAEKIHDNSHSRYSVT